MFYFFWASQSKAESVFIILFLYAESAKLRVKLIVSQIVALQDTHMSFSICSQHCTMYSVGVDILESNSKCMSVKPTPINAFKKEGEKDIIYTRGQYHFFFFNNVWPFMCILSGTDCI